MAATFPQNFGQYILLRKIAMGGMAEIFRAKTLGAEGFEKDIVIKRILPHYTEDEDFVKMFIDEASIAAKLQHANIVQIFDFNVVDGCYYIAMEYVEGNDLKKVMDLGQKGDKPLTPAQCVWIVMEIAKGLHHAHIKTYKGQPLNIVHRDISPQNAMISFNGEVKLMDFGIAKAASRSTKTVAGTVKGKCAYMSPEQARGKPLDGRSDLFGLAVVLWEMLTHKRLFLGNSDFVTLSNVLKQEAPAPSSVNPDVPEGLDAILLKALEKDREQRQETVEAFNRDLTKWFYSNVEDLDAVKLRPFMHELFADDLEKIRQWNQEENDMVAAAQEERSQTKNEPHVTDDATVALPAADFDPHAAKTVMDGELTADSVKQALANAKAQQSVAQEQTVALSTQGVVQTATGTAAVAGTGNYEQRGSSNKMLLILALVILLAGGGVAAAILLGGGGKGGAEPQKDPSTATTTEGESSTQATTGPSKGTTTKAGTATTAAVKNEYQLKIVPTPASAKVQVTFDGNTVDYAQPIKLKKGTKVTIKATAPGHKAHEETLTIASSDESLRISLLKIGASPVGRLFIQPSVADATVTVKGDLAAFKKAGTVFVGTTGEIKKDAGGNWVLAAPPGTMAEVTVKAKSGKGKTVSKKVRIGDPPTKFDLQVPVAAAGPQLASITVKCSQSSAKVTSTAGQVKTDSETTSISGLVIGQKGVQVTCSGVRGYESKTQAVDITAKGLNITIQMAKKKAGTPRPKGHGTIVVNARPWAKCTVKGKTKMTKATFTRVPAGRVRVRCVFKGKKKSRTVTLKANGKKRVGFHFTKP